MAGEKESGAVALPAEWRREMRVRKKQEQREADGRVLNARAWVRSSKQKFQL